MNNNVLTIFFNSIKPDLFEREPFEFKYIENNILGIDSLGEDILLNVKDLYNDDLYVFLKFNEQTFLRRTQKVENKYLIKTFWFETLSFKNEELAIKLICNHYSHISKNILGAVLDYKGYSEDYMDWADVFIKKQTLINYFPELIVSREKLFISQNSFNKASACKLEGGFYVYKR